MFSEWIDSDRMGASFMRDNVVIITGEGLIDCTLPHKMWTHDAHLAAAIYLLRTRPALDAYRSMQKFIRRYNEANNIQNTDTGGFHATITNFYLQVVEDFLGKLSTGTSLGDAYRQLLNSPIAKRDYPLKFYSKRYLFSKKARFGWVEPDLQPVGRKNFIGVANRP